ncbi:Coenzyme F420 hydrogenase/dehydrogenase, beta subunit C-terminal domain [Vibrio diabolicus]|uniref:Coenzyme F420 hydrogenase/dehydrogenase, beta subunit C-terminal domain n=1 Tax=Vibrio diabolicus TaxID=50719 RepID=UPI003750E90E
MTINKVIDDGYCVGCGACSVILKDKVNIQIQENGFYKSKLNSSLTNDEKDSVSRVCPFSDDALNEDELGSELFTDITINKNSKLGFYSNVYAGKIVDDTLRINSSSGGLTTWFAEKLFLEGLIDSVIHVTSTTGGEFQYTVSTDIESLRNPDRKKSRYSPVTYSILNEYILNTDDRVMFIGVPCFVKSIRLLQRELKLTNIKYVVSLLCGHMKSSGFGEALAWEGGVKPNELDSLDFRVKKEGYSANNYFFRAISKEGRESVSLNSNLFVSNWGWGFFKHKACDYCDDVAGELADVTFGDAWLNKYISDSLGTNVIVSRSSVFDSFLKKYSHEIQIEQISVNDFVSTQGGNFRHRVDGLPYRCSASKGWVPRKRLYLAEPLNSSQNRKNLYVYREFVSNKSIEKFLVAKKFNSFILFKILMLPYILKLDFIDGGARKLIVNQIKVWIPQRIMRRLMVGKGTR